MANQIPGMDEVLRFLQEQQAAENAKFNKGAPQPAPSMSNTPQGSPTISNVPTGKAMSSSPNFPSSGASSTVGSPSSLSAGNFSRTVREAGNVVKKALGRVASPSVSIPVMAMAKPAWDLGEAGADMAMGNMRDESGSAVDKNSPRGQRLMREQAGENDRLPVIDDRPYYGPENKPYQGPENSPYQGPENKPYYGPENKPYQGPSASERLPDRERVLGPQDRADYPTITAGTATGPSAMTRFLKSYGKNLIGQAPITGTEGMDTAEDYGRRAANITTPLSLMAGGAGALLKTSVVAPSIVARGMGGVNALGPQTPTTLGRAIARTMLPKSVVAAGGAVEKGAKAVSSAVPGLANLGKVGVAGGATAGAVEFADKQLKERDNRARDTSSPSSSARDDRPYYGPLESERLSQAEKAPTLTPVQESAALAGLDYPEDETVEVVPDNEGQELQAMQETGQESSSGVKFGSAQEAAQAENQQVMAAINSILQPQSSRRGTIQETTPESDEAFAKVTKPNEQPKETLGHKFKRFIVAGSGPVNFNRIDLQEAEARLAQQAMTDKEKAIGNVAATDKAGAKSFNRQSVLLDEGTGGMNDRDKAQLGFLMDQYKMAGGDARAVNMAGIEHKNRMTEIAAGAANQKLSPEQQKRQALVSVAEKNPDIFSADQLQEIFGARPSPEALKVLQDARLKDNPMTLMLSQILAERFQQMKGQAGTAPKPPVSVRALTEKTEPKK